MTPGLLPKCARWITSLACIATVCAYAEAVTLHSLLREMADLDALARFPALTYTQGQGSTYNRASRHHDQADQTFSGWFADSDGVYYIRTETTNSGGLKEYVVMEHFGPGAITKLWTPFFYRDFNNRSGPNIRIYLNGSTTPVLDENLIELVTRLEWSTAEYGAKPAPRNSFTLPPPLANFTARAGNCYLPIPFAQSCKVTITGEPFYDIVSYRAYPAGTTVENFSLAAFNSETNQAQLTQTISKLTRPRDFSGGQLFQRSATLASGDSLALTLNTGPSAVRHLEIQLDPAELRTNSAALRSTVLLMTFDGQQTVWCPLGDFFCSPDALHPLETWTRSVTTNNAVMVCRWVMPYQDGATIALTNAGPAPVTARVAVRTGAWQWDASSMHFHANWRPDDAHPGTPPSDWNFIDVRGKGVFVGDVWTVLNIQPGTWWGEGDEKIYVDSEYEGAKFPGVFGTGTEDYYGWAGGVVPTRTDEFHHPYLANVRVGGLDGYTLGFNINTRVRGLDAVPFHERLRFDMESSFGTDIRNPWNLLGYSAVTFWYAVPGATHNRPPQPEAAARPIQTVAELQRQSDAIRFPPVVPNGMRRPRWNMGEQDPEAANGKPGNPITRDANGTNDLSAVGSPKYSADVSGPDSTLSMSFDGSSFYQGSGPGISALYRGFDFNNCAISCDVYPTALGRPGFSFPFSIGGNGTGFAVVEIGGRWHIINHGVGYSPPGPAVVLNKWTRLMLVRNDFGSGVETRLFIDGTNNGIASSGTPRPPADFFFVAANRIASGPEGHFQGQIDNVVVENASPVFLQPVQVSPTANVSAGGSFTLSAVASGVQPLNFAWRRNGMVVTNTGSAPSAAFVGVSSAQSGDYDVVVTNGFGSSTGQLVSISVTATHTVSPATLTAQMKSDRLEVQCVGTPGATYMLWRTPDLAPAAWINISAGSSDASGKLLLTDPFPPVTGAYYRASALNLKEL